jgi:hypothetical protein
MINDVPVPAYEISIAECKTEETISTSQFLEYEMSETDLSFYDALACGLCSGNASSTRPDPTKTASEDRDFIDNLKD